LRPAARRRSPVADRAGGPRGRDRRLAGAALRWIAAACATDALTWDIEKAATRIHDLVAAVKKFTYMDNLAAPESVGAEAGLGDTVRVLAAKARAKRVAVTMDIAPGLPHVHANGGELNQIWANLVDNTFDAVPESGHVRIDAREEMNRVVVRVTDDGPGIPPDVLPPRVRPVLHHQAAGAGHGARARDHAPTRTPVPWRHLGRVGAGPHHVPGQPVDGPDSGRPRRSLVTRFGAAGRGLCGVPSLLAMEWLIPRRTDTLAPQGGDA